MDDYLIQVLSNMGMISFIALFAAMNYLSMKKRAHATLALTPKALSITFKGKRIFHEELHALKARTFLWTTTPDVPAPLAGIALTTRQGKRLTIGTLGRAQDVQPQPSRLKARSVDYQISTDAWDALLSALTQQDATSASS